MGLKACLSFFLLLAGLLSYTPKAWAWGHVGHQTVAYIAQDRLAPGAQRAVAEILGPDQDLADVSTWADAIVKVRPETASWHFFNLDVRQDQSEYDISDVCPQHNCVVDQINKDVGVLQEPFAPKWERRRL